MAQRNRSNMPVVFYLSLVFSILMAVGTAIAFSLYVQSTIDYNRLESKLKKEKEAHATCNVSLNKARGQRDSFMLQAHNLKEEAASREQDLATYKQKSLLLKLENERLRQMEFLAENYDLTARYSQPLTLGFLESQD